MKINKNVYIIPQHGDNGKSCVEHDTVAAERSKPDHASRDPARREWFGADTGIEVPRESARGNGDIFLCIGCSERSEL